MAAKTRQTTRSAAGARRSKSSGQTKRTSGRAASGRTRGSGSAARTGRKAAQRVKPGQGGKAPDTKLTAGVAAISASIGAAAGALARPLVERRLRPSRRARMARLPGKAKGVVKGLR